MTISAQKVSLRAKMRLVLAQLTQSEKQRKSDVIRRKLLENEVFKKARNVLMFASTKDEPELWPILKSYSKLHKNIYIPDIYDFRIGLLSDKQSFFEGDFGITIPKQTTPINDTPLDLICLPGLAFDLQFNRLGHGFGWYDKALKKIKVKSLMGLCFHEQIVDSVPVNSFDMKINQLICD